MENVTNRNKIKSQSNFDLSRDLSESDTTIMDSTMRSLPNLSIDSEEMTELKLKFDQLLLELDGANLEIENLNIENNRLKQELEQNKKQVETLKKLGITSGGSTGSSGKNKSKKKKQNRRDVLLSESITEEYKSKKEKCTKKLDYKEQESGDDYVQIFDNNTNTDCQEQMKVNENYVQDSVIIEHEDEQEYKKYTEISHETDNNVTKNIETIEFNADEINEQVQEDTTKPNISTLKGNTKKIVIIGDQQARDVQRILQKLMGPNYFITSYWKPGAVLEDIIASCYREISCLGENDFIIVLGGTNDTNPTEFHFHMKTFLKYTKHTNVLVSEVPYNKHLNERKLNYELRFVCNGFKHTLFVDMNYVRTIPYRKVFALNLSRVFHKEIIHIEYKINKIKYDDQVQALTYNVIKPCQIDNSTQTEDYTRTVTPTRDRQKPKLKKFFRTYTN